MHGQANIPLPLHPPLTINLVIDVAINMHVYLLNCRCHKYQQVIMQSSLLWCLHACMLLHAWIYYWKF